MQTSRAYPDQTKLSNTIIFHRGDKRTDTGDHVFMYNVTALMHTERIDPKGITTLSDAFLYEYCITQFGSTKSWMKEGKAQLYRRICEFIFGANMLLSNGLNHPTICIIDDSIMGILDGIEETYITTDATIESLEAIFARALKRVNGNTKHPTKVI